MESFTEIAVAVAKNDLPGQRRRLPARQRMNEFEVAAKPPEVDLLGMEKRCIRLFIIHKSQVWLHLEDIDWAVKYMATQHLLKGVAAVEEADPGPGRT